MKGALSPLRLIPRRSPGFVAGLAISAAAMGAAVGFRALLLGPAHANPVSATTFPALIVATLYAGARWGWATLGAVLAIGLVSPAIVPVGINGFQAHAMFALSAALTVLVCSALREALLQLDEASAAQAAAQQTLEATETRFRALADSAPILMWVTRADRRREFVNKACADFLGLGFEEALEFDWREILHSEDSERSLREQEIGESSENEFSLEARCRRSDGEYRWLRSISQPRYAPDGRFDGFVGVSYDNTDTKRAEADLRRINDLLAERAQEALAERDEAEAALQRAQKLEAVGLLTGGVAHDFNNLLTVVIGALDLMQRHPNDAARRERMIEAAQGAARRGERLTHQLLAFSRRQQLKPEPVQVDALVRDSEPLLRHAVGEAVDLEIATSAPDAVVNLDPSQFEAAVMNLVVNARDATPNGGVIRINTWTSRLAAGEVEALEAGEFICVAVQDNGAGMDGGVMARAFEPFYTTKPQGRGTGLGLSQVYGFARQSGGAATVESEVGVGSRVCLYLPLLPAGLGAPRPDVSPRAAEPGPPLNILLVEDDLEVAALVEAMLRDLGHEVRSAPHAQAALAILHESVHFDLLLTDLIMPGERSGVDLAREAVAMRPGLPVILSSGYTGDVLSTAEDAPWPLLRKPYGPHELARILTEVTQAPDASETSSTSK